MISPVAATVSGLGWLEFVIPRAKSEAWFRCKSVFGGVVAMVAKAWCWVADAGGKDGGLGGRMSFMGRVAGATTDPGLIGGGAVAELRSFIETCGGAGVSAISGLSGGMIEGCGGLNRCTSRLLGTATAVVRRSRRLPSPSSTGATAGIRIEELRRISFDGGPSGGRLGGTADGSEGAISIKRVDGAGACRAIGGDILTATGWTDISVTASTGGESDAAPASIGAAGAGAGGNGETDDGPGGGDMMDGWSGNGDTTVSTSG